MRGQNVYLVEVKESKKISERKIQTENLRGKERLEVREKMLEKER